MKKTLIISASALLLLSACNKESNFETVGTYYVANLITPADESKQSYVTSGEYSIKMVNNKVESVAAANLYIGGNQSNFTTGPLSTDAATFTSGIAGTVIGFKGSSGMVGQMPVQNIDGYISGACNYVAIQVPGMSYTPSYSYGPLLYMHYNLGDDYSVYTFSSDTYYSGTTRRDFSVNGQNQHSELTNCYYRVKFNPSYTKADVVLYNVRLSDSQTEAMESVRLKDLDVAFSKGAFVVSGSDIVPLVTKGGSGVESPEYTLSEIRVSTMPGNMAGINLSYATKDGKCMAQFEGYCAIINVF